MKLPNSQSLFEKSGATTTDLRGRAYGSRNTATNCVAVAPWASSQIVARNRGFTLVEALAVVALVAIVLPVVMYGISQSSNAAGLVSERTVAGRLAADKLTEMIVSNQWASGDAAGDVTDAALVYHWTFHTQPWTAPVQTTVFSGANQNTVQANQTGGGNLANQTSQTNQNNLANVLQLDVQVTWQVRGSTRTVTASTLYYEGAQGALE